LGEGEITMKDEYDVIVVGGGGSGLAAAMTAAECGAEVLLLEKQPHLGGATGIAVGSFTASGTVLQQKAGISDNPDDHEEDAGKFGPQDYQERNNNELRRFFLGHAADTLHWLMDLGLVFHGPNPEPPNRVPRMHNVVPNAKAYIAVLQTRLLRAGGTIAVDSPAEELIVENGRIVGLVARIDGRPKRIRTRRGVVLAAGDYANAPDMIGRFRGQEFTAVEGIHPYTTGDGHRLAEQAGARMVNMDITYGPELRFIPPPGKGFEQLLPSKGLGMKLMGMMMPLVPKAVIHRRIKRLLVTWQHPEDSLLDNGAIMVNRDGRRFTNEKVSPEREIAVAAQSEKIAYIVLDERLIDVYSEWPNFISTAPEIAYAYVADYLRLRRDVAAEARSLDDLAAARTLPADGLRETIEQYNRYANGEEADLFGRTDDSQPLTGGRWVLLGPVKAYFTTTEGGAAVNEQMQVMDQDDRPIAGLYAAGQNGLGGQVLWGHGLHIAWAITSGRLVGESLGKQSSPS